MSLALPTEDFTQHLINKCIEKDIQINHTKIQRLLLLIYGIRLSQGRRIIDTKPLYMPYGLVFMNALHYTTEFGIEKKNHKIKDNLLSEEDCITIDEVLKQYGDFSADRLQKWMIEKETSFDICKQSGMKFGSPVPDKVITEYFKNL